MKIILNGAKKMCVKDYTCAICAVNSKYIHSSLSVWCLLAGVREYAPDINAFVLESTINADENELLEKIKAAAPRAVAFSCYIWNINRIYKMLPLVKKALPESVIILGGPEVSYNSAEVMKTAPQADYIICGEGEKPLALLLSCLANGQNAENAGIPGLRTKESKQTVTVPNTPCEIPPSPYCKEYFETLGGRIAYLETSRGCPYSCAFCLSGRCGGVRFYSIERAKSEMLLLAQSGAKTVKLVDRTFNSNEKRARELWKFVIDNYGEKIPRGVCFHFEIAGDILSEESIRLLQRAPVGSIQLEIGMQSFNEKTLAVVNRKTDTKKLCKNIKALLEKGNIHIHIDLIAGLPLEDMKSFENSFNTGYRLKAHMLQLGFLKLLHGSALRDTADENGCVYSKTAPYEILYNNIITREEMHTLHLAEDALERFCNSGRFVNTVKYAENAIEKSPFRFYIAMGKATENTQGISLDDYTALVYGFLTEELNLPCGEVRDALVCDRLSTGGTGKLPPCLKIKDERLKTAVMRIENIAPQPKSVRRGVALLYSRKTAVYVDYIKEEKNSVTKAWPLNFVPFEKIF